ncbi:hypothetical protein MaudCBS49596_006963 [Microsporum audouinii]
MSVGSATSEEPVKRSWSFSRLFGMRFEKQADSPQVLLTGCAETADCSTCNTQDSRHSSENKARNTRGSLRFFSRQKSPVPSDMDVPAKQPLRRARSTLGFFRGTFKAKSFFKHGNITTSQHDQNVPATNYSDPPVTGSDAECELQPKFAPICPATLPSIQSTRSLEEIRDNQEYNEQTRDIIMEESKGLAAPAHGLSTQDGLGRRVTLSQRLRNYFHKNKNNIQYHDVCRSLDFLSIDIATLNSSYFTNFDHEQNRNRLSARSSLANTVSHTSTLSLPLNAHVSPGIPDTWTSSPPVNSYESLASDVGTAVDEDFGAELCRTQCLADGNSSLTLDNTRLSSWLSSVTSKPLPIRSSVDQNTQAIGNWARQQQTYSERQALQQELFADSLLISPEEYPIAAQRVMSGALSPESPGLTPLPAIHLQGTHSSTISLSLSTSPGLPTHLQFMVEAIDKTSGDYMTDSRQCSRTRIPQELDKLSHLSKENEAPTWVKFSKLCSERSAQLRADRTHNIPGKSEAHTTVNNSLFQSIAQESGSCGEMPLSTSHNQLSSRSFTRPRPRGSRDTESQIL